MTYIPNKQNKFNILISLPFLLIVFISAFLCKTFGWSNTIWQGVFFVLAILYCELLTKYILPIYTYTLDDISFKIIKTMGNKAKLVCDIDNPRIVALLTKKEYKKQEEYNVRSVYNYNANIFSPSCKVLIFEYNSFCEAVIFEPDDNMSDFILDLIKNR